MLLQGVGWVLYLGMANSQNSPQLKGIAEQYGSADQAKLTITSNPQNNTYPFPLSLLFLSSSSLIDGTGGTAPGLWCLET